MVVNAEIVMKSQRGAGASTSEDSSGFLHPRSQLISRSLKRCHTLIKNAEPIGLFKQQPVIRGQNNAAILTGEQRTPHRRKGVKHGLELIGSQSLADVINQQDGCVLDQRLSQSHQTPDTIGHPVQNLICELGIKRAGKMLKEFKKTQRAAD